MVRKFGTELREFLMRGNVIDLAVGVVIGGAFGTIVKSLVDDVIMPPIGLLLNGVDFSELFITLSDGKGTGDYATLAAAQAAGAVTLNYGLFINAIIQFMIVGTAIFMLVRTVNKLHRKKEEAPAEVTTKECGFCFSEIPLKAHRCPHCTSQLDNVSDAQ